MTKKISADTRGDRLERTLQAGDFPAALELARAAWETSRAPSLAVLVERISSRVPAGAADWSRSPEQITCAALPAYLESLLTRVKFAEALQRLERLEELPPDPRVAAALTRMLLAPPFTAQSSRKAWQSVERQLTGQHADPRTLSALQPVAATYTKIFGGTVMGKQMEGRVQAMVAELQQRFPAVEDDAGAGALVARLDASAPPPKAAAPAGVSEADLLAAVYENPDDDGPRLVYADWLLEHGDPRGELITLQYRRHRGEALSPAEEKRENALLAKHTATWLGPIYKVLFKNRTVFRRGFIEIGWLQPRGSASAAAANHPAWATVRELRIGDVPSGDHGAHILVQPAMRRLRVLLNAPADVVEAVAGVRDHGLEILGTSRLNMRDVDPERGPWPALLRAPGLPRLRQLQLELGYYSSRDERPPELWAGLIGALWTSPLGARLERLSLSGLSAGDVDAWAAWLTANPPPAACRVEVELSTGDATVRVRGGKAGEREPRCPHPESLLH